MLIWYSFGVLLGWISFGTWMYDVAHDIYDNYNSCLTALYSLMLSFNCLIDSCCIFYIFCTDDCLVICGAILRGLLSCIYIGLVIKVIDDACSEDSKFEMTPWYWALFSTILISSFMTGPYYAIDYGCGAILKYCNSEEY